MQEAIQEFIKDELERKLKAARWLLGLKRTLSEIAPHLFGRGVMIGDIPSFTVDISDEVYFRYKEDLEGIGFFYHDHSQSNTNGDPVDLLTGPSFWNAIHEIHDWCEGLRGEMEQLSEFREDLVNKLK